MFDLETKFNEFYKNKVSLFDEDISELRKKKRLNLDRLRDGLKEYNEENETDYKLVDDIEQGSVAMRTVIQLDENEYDIDVAIVFDKDNIPESTQKVKTIIEDALQRKCTQFKAAPEAKTNAVRLDYASGYHIDFAIYRRMENQLGEFEFEHCGSEWRERDPRAINKWFNTENDCSDKNIRKVIRLLKAFCKQNSGWLMPGGLILTILVAEKIRVEDRFDKTFYETVKAIKERLDTNKEVCNPTLNGNHSILYKKKDHQKIKNLHTRLEIRLKKLDVLFENDCDEAKAMAAWKEFFGHSFWGEDIQKSAFVQEFSLESKNERLLNLNADVLINNKVKIPLSDYKGKLPKGCKIFFSASPLVKYSHIEWVVNNTGDEAINDTYHKKTGRAVEENTLYRGRHTMTCKVYEGTRLIAQKVIPVNIK
ncbi:MULTISPECIES: nucleotidyltransferase [Bacillus]|uniref:Cyclic GMP-AMP synthase n=1 Tax=Bacillus paralicheniformis TaxID=1648923 RepID=A0ABY3FZ21_9BACI|nr:MULTISPECIES: nucleotidyltransferase [Bacillus]MCY8038498.1 nucleotidyltransferase [Bacillus paralicheniformis]MCY8180539.1 nucleotidyltransferase [Bacillus paralicheniformis]MDE1362914.1 nucleotidyltransferase [Bacillus paralicheniformis]MDE1383888.1 nucleotidyltransferase [Bacillus paralicheniformis]MEC2098045.1 nucleotidyltransferase [Bacillus paralicheniformis]